MDTTKLKDLFGSTLTLWEARLFAVCFLSGLELDQAKFDNNLTEKLRRSYGKLELLPADLVKELLFDILVQGPR